MSLRRLHHRQPEGFAFTPANLEWAQGQIAKYPEGRQASAVIPLLWRAQEQEGWVTRPIVETVARMLDMAQIRVLEVATFYFMFQLEPVGTVAHVQVCGTTPCMLCGSEDLIAVCRDRIAAKPHTPSPCGKLSWEEVECMGACSNAPMAQIGKDYYEDLTAERFGELLDALLRGEVPRPGSQTGRWASEPVTGLTSLTGEPTQAANGSVELALALGDTLRRIDGTEATASMLALGHTAANRTESPEGPGPREEPETPPPPGDAPREETERRVEEATARPEVGAVVEGMDGPIEAEKPPVLQAAQGDGPDDLKRIKGIGPKLEEVLHELGVFHFHQIANWSDAQVLWVEDHLNFKGRVGRDDWITQARALADEQGDA